MNLTAKEVQTVLAALRFWKEENVEGMGFAEFFAWCDPLNEEEIDRLDERLKKARE